MDTYFVIDLAFAKILYAGINMLIAWVYSLFSEGCNDRYIYIPDMVLMLEDNCWCFV